MGLAAFFAKVSYKATQEWKEEVVYASYGPAKTLRHPKTKAEVKPKFLGGEVVEAGKEEDPREKFAAWLTAPQNPWFARNIVNRVWFWLLGRGIVHEPDDLRPTNPPENPELLAYLEQELIGHQYDLKHVYRLILNSRTYQLSSVSNPWNEKDLAHFSHYQPKRLSAEQLLDAVDQITETPETFSSRIPEPFTHLPAGFRASSFPTGTSRAPFLELFGRSPRNTPYESERSAGRLPVAHALLHQLQRHRAQDREQSPLQAAFPAGQERRGGRGHVVPGLFVAASRRGREEKGGRILRREKRQPHRRSATLPGPL